ncbi:hypothetical protein ABIC03_001523 [Bradyrhizobium sp. RT6a]|uniref:hypothetical protein n=1 Tax=unclassified Bradyrhizobium TaxID=2631580 RepID=UPI003396985D
MSMKGLRAIAARRPWSGGVDAGDFCDDGILPVFCPTSQTKIAKRAILVRANPCPRKSLFSQVSATVHGVVFAFLFRSGSDLPRDGMPDCKRDCEIRRGRSS